MTLSFTARWRDELPATYTALLPTPLKNARLIWYNDELAQQLAIPASLFDATNGAGVWGGETLLPGMSPVAQVYSGHQFGIWAGQLGDGRGILLGEQLGGWLDPRLASERRRINTLFANGRWTRRPAFNHTRKSCQRSYALSGYSHYARVIYRSQRYAGSARDAGNGRDVNASGTKSYAFWSFRTFLLPP